MTRGVEDDAEDDDGTAVLAQALEWTTCTSVQEQRMLAREVLGTGLGLSEEKIKEILEEWD
jgi:hypothetical protein